MADEASEHETTYRRVIWSRTLADWKPTRDRLIWGVVAATIASIVAAAVGSQMRPPQTPLLTAPVEAIGGVVLAAAVYLLWSRFRAPSKIWAYDQTTIQRLQSELDTRSRLLELTPKQADEGTSISVLPVRITYDNARPNLEAAVVWGGFPVVIVNNDSHLTTILRLWLRVCDPLTREEISPLPAKDLPDAGVIEQFGLKGLIHARERRETELNFRQYYPRTVLELAREGKASAMIFLCVEASGLGTRCFSLPDEFFEARSTPSADPVPSTPSESDSRGSRGTPGGRSGGSRG